MPFDYQFTYQFHEKKLKTLYPGNKSFRTAMKKKGSEEKKTLMKIVPINA